MRKRITALAIGVLMAAFILNGCGAEALTYYSVKYTGEGVAEIIKQVKSGDIAEDWTPEYTGHKFEGWLEDGKQYTFTQPVGKNITLTAKWTKHTYSFKFEGYPEKNQTVAYGEQAEKPADPYVEEKIFIGWFLGEVIYDFESAVTGAVVLAARFVEKYFYGKLQFPDADGVQAVMGGDIIYLNYEDADQVFYKFNISTCKNTFLYRVENPTLTNIIGIEDRDLIIGSLHFENYNPIRTVHRLNIDGEEVQTFIDASLNSITMAGDGYLIQSTDNESDPIVQKVAYRNGKGQTKDIYSVSYDIESYSGERIKAISGLESSAIVLVQILDDMTVTGMKLKIFDLSGNLEREVDFAGHVEDYQGIMNFQMIGSDYVWIESSFAEHYIFSVKGSAAEPVVYTDKAFALARLAPLSGELERYVFFQRGISNKVFVLEPQSSKLFEFSLGLSEDAGLIRYIVNDSENPAGFLASFIDGEDLEEIFYINIKNEMKEAKSTILNTQSIILIE